MILFSIITMRDLIRNYRMIIRGKNQESDSETEPLASSTSTSSTQSFGTIREPRMFKQESYCTESDDESMKQAGKNKKSPKSTLSLQGKSKLLFPSHDVTNERYTSTEYIYDFPPYTECKRQMNLLASQEDYVNETAIRVEEQHKSTHHSVVTIFAVWNTTMGSSILAMSWGLGKAGLFPSIIIIIAVAALSLYTAYVLLNVNQKHGLLGQNVDVPHLCRLLIGKWAEILAKIFSLIVLIGANIVYWILMSNFLFNSVIFLYEFFIEANQVKEAAVICPKQISLFTNNTVLGHNVSYINPHPTFDKVWDLYTTVPIFLAVLMFPVLNFKSPTFFTKFNSFGTISVGYLLLFVAVKFAKWGVNMQDWTSEFHLKPTFCALSGMLSLSYFIHNIIISIMRNNKHQKHNGRDLSIAFGLITFTYIFIGVLFYISFPLAKSCIEDNILNNFSKGDAMAIIARVLLLFQLFTVFPLISFMLRNDILGHLSKISMDYSYGEFSYGKVVVINAIVLFVCIMFACFLPRIGTLIRYTGALSGLVYIFMLPSLLKIASLKKEQRLTMTKLIIHIAIVVTGVINLISQFFINDK